MINFLKETLTAIAESGHSRDDVMFIGSRDGEYRLSMNEFVEIANFNYDNGFGAQEIASDLIVYFNDGSYLVRREYDGAEYWEFINHFNYKEDDDYKPFYYFMKYGYSYVTVKEINEQGEE